MIKFRNNNILLLGDVHSAEIIKNIIKVEPSLDGFDIFQCGDYGLGFAPREKDMATLYKTNELCKSRNIRLFAIRGNHDKKSFWEVNFEFSNLFLVPDYTEAVFPNGKTALLVGGGISIDRFYRKLNIDYWANEVTVYRKMDKTYDYLFSHDAPDYFNHSTESLKHSPWKAILNDDKTLFDEALAQREVMNKIVEDIKPKAIFHGHMHNKISDIKNGIYCRCVDVNELLEFDSTKI